MITHYIPFNQIDLIKDLDLESSNLFIVNIDLYLKIINRDDLPTENKEIAIKNILAFIRYIQANKNKDNTINIAVSKTKTNINHNIERFFSSRHYIKYMKILYDLNIITTVLNDDSSVYTPKIYTKKYLINEDIYKDLVIVYFDNTIKNSKRIDVDKRLKGISKKYINTIKTIKIDILSAYEAEYNDFINNKIKIESFISRINRLFVFTDEAKYIKKGNKVDRILHNISNLSSNCRKHINIKFNYIDICNAQPLLLIYILKKNNYNIDENYINDCSTGVLYEQFYNKTFFISKKKLQRDFKTNKIKKNDKGNMWYIDKYFLDLKDDSEIDRPIIKENLYSSVYFKFDESNDFNKEFKKLYPITWNSYKDLLDKQENTSAFLLQNTEASIINPIVPENSKFYFTLYDGIYFDDINDAEQIMNEIKTAFNNQNISNIKIEFNNKNNKITI